MKQASAQSAGQAVPMVRKAVPVVLAGITLEYNTVEDVVKQTEMTVAEIEGVMGVNSAWPFPGHEDGGSPALVACTLPGVPCRKRLFRAGHMLHCVLITCY